MRLRNAKITGGGATITRSSPRRGVAFGVVGLVSAFLVATAVIWGAVVVSARGTTAVVAPSAVVAQAGAQEIPAALVGLYVQEFRSQVIADYSGMGVDTSSTSFWTSSVAGSTPGRKLATQALTQSLRLIVEFRLARLNGVAAPGDFGDLIVQWQEENQRRQASVEAHLPIYGPVQYTLRDYLDYTVGNLEYATADALAAHGVIDGSDSQLANYYNNHKATFGDQPLSEIKESVRRALLEDEYQQYVTFTLKDIPLSRTPAFDEFAKSTCIQVGQCSYTG